MPRASWLLIVCTESDGFATKKAPSGIVRPAVIAWPHEVPLVWVCAEGTRTAYRPGVVQEQVRLLAADRRRRERGVRRVGEGRIRGAPSTPAKT